MVRRYTSIIGTPLTDFNEGDILALLRDIIVNPETGKVEAFWVKPVGHIFENLIIQTQDILEWKKKIYIRSEVVMARPEEIVRVAHLLSKNIPVIDQKVLGQSGKYYGRVSDLDFEDQTFLVKQIWSQKRFLGIFSYTNDCFAFDRILEMTHEKILVDDDSRTKQIVISPTLSVE